LKLSEIGEEALIGRIAKMNRLPTSAEGLIVGIGDDAAVLSPDANGDLILVTTDMLSEGVDFRLDIITPYQLGWKSAAANISDIAAMGGTPTWTFASVGFRPETEVEFVDRFFAGIVECAARFGSTLAGGDTNEVAGDYAISITQMGRVPQDRLLRRSGAKPGDKILVTGWLGNSRGGLELLLKYGFDEAARLSSYLVEAHLMPTPRVPEATVAARTRFVRSAMDLSDGLGADLPKLCAASGCGAIVYADRLPISDDLRRAGEILQKDAGLLAAGGGEDFELLMSVDPKNVDAVISKIELATQTPVTEIGEITSGNSVEIVDSDGLRRPIAGGWEHFA
jgi:thiamine-monophosphate kinase